MLLQGVEFGRQPHQADPGARELVLQQHVVEAVAAGRASQTQDEIQHAAGLLRRRDDGPRRGGVAGGGPHGLPHVLGQPGHQARYVGPARQHGDPSDVVHQHGDPCEGVERGLHQSARRIGLEPEGHHLVRTRHGHPRHARQLLVRPSCQQGVEQRPPYAPVLAVEVLLGVLVGEDDRGQSGVQAGEQRAAGPGQLTGLRDLGQCLPPHFGADQVRGDRRLQGDPLLRPARRPLDEPGQIARPHRTPDAAVAQCPEQQRVHRLDGPRHLALEGGAGQRRVERRLRRAARDHDGREVTDPGGHPGVQLRHRRIVTPPRPRRQ
ncbi:hypothetical protein [Streptomyces sp. NPDC051079]|uniref:hypothetical protein n=1 Tax=Streptomyces sp. NPDC051079 TaxID=3155043 RepID=UPI00344C2EFE